MGGTYATTQNENSGAGRRHQPYRDRWWRPRRTGRRGHPRSALPLWMRADGRRHDPDEPADSGAIRRHDSAAGDAGIQLQHPRNGVERIETKNLDFRDRGYADPGRLSGWSGQHGGIPARAGADPVEAALRRGMVGPRQIPCDLRLLAQDNGRSEGQADFAWSARPVGLGRVQPAVPGIRLWRDAGEHGYPPHDARPADTAADRRCDGCRRDPDWRRADADQLPDPRPGAPA